MITITDIKEYKGVLGTAEEYDHLIQYAKKRKKENIRWFFNLGSSLITAILLKEIRDLSLGVKNMDLKKLIDNFEKLANDSDTLMMITQG